MAVYYQFESVLSGITGGEGRDPNLLEYQKMRPENAFSKLMKPGQMKGKFLGACLDSCRIGTMTTCAWPTDVHGLMGMIEKWRHENNDQEALYHEMPLENVYSRFELPFINHESCPRDKEHASTLLDAAGRLRCAHRSVRLARPSFIIEYSTGWDHHSQQALKEIYEDVPNDPSYEDDDGEIQLTDEYDSYLEKKVLYESEEVIEIPDVCYAILKDPQGPLAFETILRRLNIQTDTRENHCGSWYTKNRCRRLNELTEDQRRTYSIFRECPGHLDHNNQCEFEFDGWTLAFYVQKWKHQPGNPKWYADKKEIWPSREDVRVCSED